MIAEVDLAPALFGPDVIGLIIVLTYCGLLFQLRVGQLEETTLIPLDRFEQVFQEG